MLPEQAAANDLVQLVTWSGEANHRSPTSLAAVSALVSQKAASIARPGGADGADLRLANSRRGAGTRRCRFPAASGPFRRAGGHPIDIGAYLHPIATGLIASLTEDDRVTLHFACELGCRAAPERVHLGQIVVELVHQFAEVRPPHRRPGCSQHPLQGAIREVS